MSATLPQGWQFIRNADGCIGIKAPPPKDGESRRTSACVYAFTDRDLHELLSKFVDHLAAAEAPTVAQPAQEPVHKPVGYVLHSTPPNFVAWSDGCLPPGGTILYAAPPQPAPLTDQQQRDLAKECGLDWHRGYMPLFDGDPTNCFSVLIEAVERAHGIGSKT